VLRFQETSPAQTRVRIIRQRGGVAISVLTDLTSDESIARLLATARAEAGPVDVLVNNAGYAVWKPLEETTSAEWDHACAVNVRAAACRSAGAPSGMQARRFGRITNIARKAGVAIVPGLAAYCGAKKVTAANRADPARCAVARLVTFHQGVDRSGRVGTSASSAAVQLSQ
jgi:3-oxoacyl-[acyl-carrier protein] reductase